MNGFCCLVSCLTRGTFDSLEPAKKKAKSSPCRLGICGTTQCTPRLERSAREVRLQDETEIGRNRLGSSWCVCRYIQYIQANLNRDIEQGELAHRIGMCKVRCALGRTTSGSSALRAFYQGSGDDGACLELFEDLMSFVDEVLVGVDRKFGLKCWRT